MEIKPTIAITPSFVRSDRNSVRNSAVNRLAGTAPPVNTSCRINSYCFLCSCLLDSLFTKLIASSMYAVWFGFNPKYFFA